MGRFLFWGFGETGLPSQALRASSPKGGATGVPGHFPLDA